MSNEKKYIILDPNDETLKVWDDEKFSECEEVFYLELVNKVPGKKKNRSFTVAKILVLTFICLSLYKTDSYYQLYLSTGKESAIPGYYWFFVFVSIILTFLVFYWKKLNKKTD